LTACYMLFHLPEGGAGDRPTRFPWLLPGGTGVGQDPRSGGAAYARTGPVKEWAYSGFGINLASAFIAHLSMRDGPDAFAPAAVKTRTLSVGFPNGAEGAVFATAAHGLH